jgi:hypothetical protein
VSDDALHAYYTMDQTTFPCKKQSHVDGLTIINKSEDGVMRSIINSKA